MSVARPSIWTGGKLAGMAAVLVGSIAAPALVGNPYYISVMTNTAIAVMLTLSMNLVNGISGQFSLAHAMFYGLGAYIPALLALRLGIDPWLGLPIAVAATAAVAVAIGIPVLRLRGYYLAVATLAFALFVELFVRQATDVTGGAYGLQNLPPLKLFGLTIKGTSYLVVAIVAVLLTYVALENLRASTLGRSIMAARDSAPAAAAAGIDVAKVRVAAFAISAGIAGLAGWTQAFFSLNLTPHLFSTELTFLWIFMVLIGGMGHTTGVILGTIFLTIAPELLGFATTQQVLALGIIMIVVALFAPRGLGGLLDGLLRRRRVEAVQ